LQNKGHLLLKRRIKYFVFGYACNCTILIAGTRELHTEIRSTTHYDNLTFMGPYIGRIFWYISNKV